MDENGNVMADDKSQSANLETSAPVETTEIRDKEVPIIRTPIKPDPIKIRGICVDTNADSDVKRQMTPVKIQPKSNQKIWAHKFYQAYQTKQVQLAMEDNQMLTDENIAMRGRINDLMLVVDELMECKASLQKEAAQIHDKLLQMEAEIEQLRQINKKALENSNVSASDETEEQDRGDGKSLPANDKTPPGQIESNVEDAEESVVTKLVKEESHLHQTSSLEKRSVTSLQLQNSVGSHYERLQRGGSDLCEKSVGCSKHLQRHPDVEESQEKFHFRARPVPNYEAIGRLPQVPKKEPTKVHPFSFCDRPTLSTIRKQQKSKETTAKVSGKDPSKNH